MEVLQIGGDRGGALVGQRLQQARRVHKISQVERVGCSSFGAGVSEGHARGGVANREVIGSAVGERKKLGNLRGEEAA